MLQGTSLFVDGPMGSGQVPTAQDIARREVWVAAQGLSTRPVMLRTAHGKQVTWVDASSAGTLIDGDGLLTRERQLPLMMTHSDCLPVVFWDAKETVCGIVHAGWRGVVEGIVPEALGMMREHGAADIRLHIGPHIRSCCFAIQEDVAGPLRDVAEGAVIMRNGMMFGDLAAAVCAQVGSRAVITIDDRCTSCSKRDGEWLFASYRRDKELARNMVSFVALP